jgi:hypothetical protein
MSELPGDPVPGVFCHSIASFVRPFSIEVPLEAFLAIFITAGAKDSPWHRFTLFA